MKTFTVRDLDRQPAAVLEVCDLKGSVRIRRRNGRSYTLHADLPTLKPLKRKAWFAQHEEWLRRTFPKPVAVTVDQVEDFDKLIASDGRVL